jgi:hypothetical protein
MLLTSNTDYFDYTLTRFETAYIVFAAGGDYDFATGKEFYFGPNTVINTHTIVGLQAVQNTEQTTFTVANATRDIPSYAALSGGYVTLRSREGTILAEIPLTSLTRPANNSKFFELFLTDCWWQNSSVRFTAAAGMSNAAGLKFNVYLQ